MKARLAMMLLAVTGCAKVQSRLPTEAPVMVGPVDRIGGKASPLPEDAPDDAAFDGESESGAQICIIGIYPTATAWRPDAKAAAEHVEYAYANYAGKVPLRTLVPRARGVSVGAWEWLFASCYSQKKWWGIDGALEKK